MSNKKAVIITSIIIVLIFALIYFWNTSTTNFLNIKKFGRNCRIDKVCSNVLGIDCNSAVDGPYYYVDKNSGAIISRCGGYCDTSDSEQQEICKNQCPKKEWNC